MRNKNKVFCRSNDQGQMISDDHSIRGFAGRLMPKPVSYILSKDFEQDVKQIKESLDRINRVFNEQEEEAERLVREQAQFSDEINSAEETTIEELRARLEALKADVPYVSEYEDPKTTSFKDHEDELYISEFEEPMATRFDFEDRLFAFMSEIELCEEDEPLIRIATNHPAYKSFAKTYRMYEIGADELQTVRAFVRAMAPPIDKN